MRQYQILIADDEQIERLVLRTTLERHFSEQCIIYEAKNGKEAVAMAEEKRLDAVILDIEMPGIDGLQAAEEIRKIYSKCSIIFLTAFDDFGYAKKAISVRALDYLLKPFNDSELFAVVEEALRIADDVKLDNANARYKYDSDELEGGRQAVIAEKMKEYIESNYVREISMQDAASFFGYSVAYFCKLFKQTFGKSFITYLADYRVEKAKELLSKTDKNIREVSEAVGYQDANYFAKVFKRVTEKSPSEYKNKE